MIVDRHALCEGSRWKYKRRRRKSTLRGLTTRLSSKGKRATYGHRPPVVFEVHILHVHSLHCVHCVHTLHKIRKKLSTQSIVSTEYHWLCTRIAPGKATRSLNEITKPSSLDLEEQYSPAAAKPIAINTEKRILIPAGEFYFSCDQDL